jgi:hypothetical protein
MILTAFSKFTLTAFPLPLGIEEIFAPCVPNESVSEVVSSLFKLLLIGCSLLVGSLLCSFIQRPLRSCRDGLYNGHQRHFPTPCSLETKLGVGERILDWIFVVFGSIVAVVGTIATLQ